MEYARLVAATLGDDLKSVVLYGSVARGDAKTNSDIDLLVVADNLPEQDHNGFFQDVLARLKRKLSEYGARRVRLGNIRYWDLKPDFRWGEVIDFDE